MSKYISQDLYFMILKRLSVKTLLRFRYVCKSWKEVIDSKAFILEHLADQKPRLLLENRVYTPPKYFQYDPETLTNLGSDEFVGPDCVEIDGAISDCPFSKILRPYSCKVPNWHWILTVTDVVGTVDGVICLYNYKTCFLLWNPSIRRLLALPLPEKSIPSYDDSFCGFWIDPSNTCFKVMVFCTFSNTIAVFSSRKRAWTKLDTEPIAPFVIEKYCKCLRLGNPHILVQGVGHWLACDLSLSNHGGIFTFDYRKDEFGLLKFPKVFDDRCPSLTKWHGFVAIADARKSWPHLVCDLWAMRDGTWSKMLSYNFAEKLIQRVLYVVDDNDKVLVSSGAQFRSYAFEDGFSRSMISIARADFPIYDFVETLVFPNQNWYSS